MQFISAILILAFFINSHNWFGVYSDHIVEKRTNSRWTSSGCTDIDDVFGAIRIAMIREPREVYLSLDFSWLEKVLFEDRKVFVECIPIDKLGDIVMPDYDEPFTADTEAFRVIYSQVPQGSYKPTAHTSDGPIDSFLLKNPCWSILVR